MSDVFLGPDRLGVQMPSMHGLCMLRGRHIVPLISMPPLCLQVYSRAQVVLSASQ